MPRFQTTRWSLVVAAGQLQAPEARDALAALCQTYWYPLYAFLRRWGHEHQAAEDLVQGFFLHLLEKDIVGRADPDRGRFRTFLLTALKNFAANEYERGQARKRGGGRTLLRLDDEDAEGRYALEPVDLTDPERLYERRWALTLLDRAKAHLRRDFVQAGKVGMFEVLEESLTEERPETPYREIAAALGTTEGAARVAVHRLRKRFRKHIEREIAETVVEPGTVEAELRFLQTTLEAGGRRVVL